MTLLYLGHDLVRRHLPGTLGALWLWLVAILDAVVLICLTHRAQRFVVQAGQAERFFEFLSELVQCF